MIKFNLNQRVTITWTDEGKRLMREKYSFDISDNTYSCEFWKLMYDFGQYMYNGNPSLPFLMEVTVEEMK